MTNQNLLIATRLRLVGVVAGGCLAVAAAAQAPVQTPEFGCFPTCAADGRFLVVTGNDPTTLAAPQVVIGLTFPLTGGLDKVDFGLLDGDRDPIHWDVKNAATNTAAPQLELALYADGAGAGAVGRPIKTWAAGEIPFESNAWTDVTLAHDPSALTPSGSDQSYRYALRISASAPADDLGWNAFKVRTHGTLDLPPQVIGFIAAMAVPGDIPTIYPNYPKLDGSRYDGKWTFTFRLPAGLDHVTIFDGDMDYGDAACTINDTDDRDSSGIPPFGAGAVAEGVASGGLKCTGRAGTRTGVPEEDNEGAAFRRIPGFVPKGIAYRLVAPDGQVFLNRNPSGNREWEQFKVVKVGTKGAEACPRSGFADHDCETTTLPEGVWEVQVDGMDMSNLNFFYFNYKVER